jgi:cell division GTPase FtsZ
MSNIDIDEIFGGPAPKTAEQVEAENDKLEKALAEEGRKSRMDPDVLAKLSAKAGKKEKEAPVPEVISQKEVSINIGVLGVGQAGSRIAEVFHKKGYDVGVINTSSQDLKFIDVLPHQKLLLDGSLGGTGKDLDLGRDIFEASRDEVADFTDRVLEGNDMAFLAISGGGGTGSSSVDVMVETLFATEMPVGVIYVLPKATEDAQSKRNSIETLARLARMAADNMIASLVVVDNARIETIYGGLSQAKFWDTANEAIVAPIHLFNSLTAQPSRHTSLDPSDFGKIISAGDCSVYGVVEVEDYMEETALAEAVIESLSGNMLAEGFDLTQTRVGGVIILGSDEAISKLPAINIDYCFHMISEKTNGASIYQGIYADESVGRGIKIYSWFAGLGLPQDRIENLQKESKEQAAVLAEKERTRASSMTLDLEEDKTTSVADKIHKKISKKNSGFNKLQGGARKSIIDRRRR